ncbi:MULTISPECIES: helix-turn-helix domain-containing protein [Chryseobacterium]|uniref:AraC family transcriptional activator of pobA n=1 Tax=Chryseobacterium camelliae TaxID=1265445 RepID=A0ABU0TK07_9FLAO|nr:MULTISPECIES: AraC family transcriptional regulator [Chryseobacterium]MDT3409581.1 AraC family transcriptional activator of pobA [Pseudacidovorax intermedius]MDQ1096558.1 AraC family transcriptional activator of pobA [Chryseobacterium camelliae]MDQ1100499.1 AraC family transcriptional activator of pobA [Chryseobacterium sp. SORGH_AS_1048]MDR6087839.1 AraC family transcriptional activator of pobA [Chryseobacterium sp. SORGH_AS_0909]MDR6132215.1 AraC family transcriptional activator of pobA [
MKEMFRFNSISDFHAFCDLPKPEHPLISLIDYSKVQYPVNDDEMKWIQNYYSIGLKRNVNARFNYGQQEYDFDSGVLCFVSPLQFLRIEMKPDVEVSPTGYLLLIHPDFLWGSSLIRKMKSYEFFSYRINEALFLSEKEENIIVDLFKNIEKEYRNNIDKFTQELIVAQLELFMIYSERFYERQFLTRKKSSHELLDKFEEVLSEYFESGKLLENGIPSVTAIAEQLNISPNYLGSLLRIHTQQNTQQHIQNKLIDYARERLSTTNLSVSEIAYELGFEHPQSFSKLFKQKTSQSPLEFRKLFN